MQRTCLVRSQYLSAVWSHSERRIFLAKLAHIYYIIDIFESFQYNRMYDYNKSKLLTFTKMFHTATGIKEVFQSSVLVWQTVPSRESLSPYRCTTSRQNTQMSLSCSAPFLDESYPTEILFVWHLNSTIQRGECKLCYIFKTFTIWASVLYLFCLVSVCVCVVSCGIISFLTETLLYWVFTKC